MSDHQIPSISTKEFAALIRVKSASIRRSLCIHGHYLSIKPVKLPNGRLLWPNNLARQLLHTDQNADAE